MVATPRSQGQQSIANRSDTGARRPRGTAPFDNIAARIARAFSPNAILNAFSASDGYKQFPSISYGRGLRHTLDVYRPVGARDAPIIVFFYGGSWQRGAKESYRFVAAALARRGVVAVTPDYRIFPEVRFPAFLEDGANAVAWVRENAGYFGGDPDRIVLMGHSAGAHIAAMLAIDGRWLASAGLDPRRDIDALVGLAGPYDFLPIKDATLKTIFGGTARPETQPITFVVGGEPRSLLITGPRDRTVDPGNTSRLAERLRAVGSDVQVSTPPTVGHLTIVGALAWPLRFLGPVLRDVADFAGAKCPDQRGMLP